MSADEQAPTRAVDSAQHLSALTGLEITPEQLAFAADFLREVRAAADQLRSLDLDGVTPDAVYDPRWPEAER